MAVTHIFLIALITSASASSADLVESADSLAGNPIRKVVTMLQALQKKVTAEGETEANLYEKFNCYCKNSGSTLSRSISDAEAKIPSLASDVEEAVAKQKQDQEDLKQAHTDRTDATSSMDSATAMREKAAADFATEKAEQTANIAAMSGAIAAIEKGITGFVQTDLAQRVRTLVMNTKDLDEIDRQSLVSFLSGTQSDTYVPQSGQIVGVLKELKDKMSEAFAEMESSENAAVSTHEELIIAKTKSVKALTKSIETLTVRVGSLSVEIVQMKEDRSNTQTALDQDKHFLAHMDQDCATKASEYDTNVKTRGEELLALADTIKLLNSDDALELFKKALPTVSASFLQMNTGLASQKAHALSMIAEAQEKSHQKLVLTVPFFDKAPALDFIALALHGKKVSFAKVIKMIDAMVVTLKREQTDDDHKNNYCANQFDSAGDKKKGLERSASDLDIAIAKGIDANAALKDEIDGLENGIKALDKEVADATEQRKEENKDSTEELASSTAAKQLLNMAKTRLNKFYRPQKAQPKEDGAVLAQVNLHLQGAPPPPPETAGAYMGSKDEANQGVMAALNTIIADLDKEMLEARLTEKNSQRDYEQAMQDSADRRALSTKTLTDKGASKASVEAEIEDNKADKADTDTELMATDKYIGSLHAECDFLVQYFDARKEARSGELESLQSAKAVLSGADYSLVQQGRRLRGVA